MVLALCVGGLTSIVHAGSLGSIDLSYTGMGAGSRMVINYSGSSGPTISGKTVWAGELNYTVGAASGAGASLTGQQITTFGIDIWQTAGSMNSELGKLANGPTTNGIAGQMGADRAGLLGALYSFAGYDQSMFLGGGFSGPDQAMMASAFQLAIWEIVSEDGFDPNAASFSESGLDVTSGAFSVKMYEGAGIPSTLSLAQRMLKNAWEAWVPGSETSLLIAGGNGGPDVIMIHTIPLPHTFIMTSLGLLGAIMLRRRLTP